MADQIDIVGLLKTADNGTSTTVSFDAKTSNNVDVQEYVMDASGIFASTIGSAVTVNAISFLDASNMITNAVNSLIWSFTDTDDGIMYTFTYEYGSVTKSSSVIGLDLYGTLTVTDSLNNVTNYKGEMELSTQSGGKVSFSSTTTAPVPEPTTMLLFGTGLIGLSGVTRKLRKS